jgi:hypothetical protein
MFGQGISTALLEVHHAMIAHLITSTMCAQNLSGQPDSKLFNHDLSSWASG